MGGGIGALPCASMHLAGVVVPASLARRAWDAWRADRSAAVAFLDERHAAGAAAGFGLQNVCIFRAGAALADGAPPPLECDEERPVAVPPSCDADFLDACRVAVLVLDPALAVLSKLSPRARRAIDRAHLALVCPWWPGEALAQALRERLGGRPVLAPPGAPELPRPHVERLRHGQPASEILLRLAAGCRDTAPAARVSALLACRRHAACPPVALPAGETRVLMVTDRCGATKICAPDGVQLVVCELEELLERGAPAAAAGGAWCVVFLVESLVEYTERLVVHQMAAAGASASRLISHAWTADEDAARVDGWAAAPGEGAARAALERIAAAAGGRKISMPI